MTMTRSDWRRWLGVIALGLAVVMLTAGETLLQGKLSPAGFVIYWAVCFLVTGVAIVLALAEARAVARSARQQNRVLLESTLREIEQESLTRGEKKPDQSDPA